MRILYVDEANTCTSPSAAALLNSTAQAWGLPGIRAASAGTNVTRGSHTCHAGPAMRGHRHHVTSLNKQLVDSADMILVATRDDLPDLAAIDPEIRRKTYTIRQAGRWSTWMLEKDFIAAARERTMDPEGWRDSYPSRSVRNVTPFPVQPTGVVGWVITEMDAARGVAPFGYPKRSRRPSGIIRVTPKPLRKPLVKALPAKKEKAGKRKMEKPSGPHPDDLVDPHEDPEVTHEQAYAMLWENTESLLRFLGTAGVGR